ncbi:MAG: hypothetical protein K9I85_06535 [Saprospiraceae bacterium]|nr:hypothetical protein [Saprospiraceae bacterium]
MNNRTTKPPTSSAVYGFGFIGAAVYYLSHATSFLAGVIGFLKALVWPAFLVYHALEMMTG